MRRLAAIAATVVVLLSIAGLAVASIPDPSGVIHGCRKNSDGSLRVIDSDLGQACSNGWTPLNWAQGPRPGTPYGLHRVNTDFTVPDSGRIESFWVTCPEGETAMFEQAWVGDGVPVDIQAIHPEAVAANVAPDDSPTPRYMVFYVRGGAPGTGTDLLRTYVTCGKFA